MKPDLSGDAFLRRHQNPMGMILRGFTFLALSAGVWIHAPLLIGLALLIELANWLYCPEHQRPPEWVEQIIDAEFMLIDLEPVAIRYLGIGLLVAGFGLFGLGLAAHHGATILVGFLLGFSVLCGTWALSRRP